MVRKRFEFPRRIGASSLQDLDMVEAVSLRGVEVVYLEPTYAAARSVNRPQRRGYLSRPIRAAGLRKEAGENGDNCEAQHLTYAAAQTRAEATLFLTEAILSQSIDSLRRSAKQAATNV